MSYFAAGIVAHLVCAGNDCWKQSGINQDDLLNELVSILSFLFLKGLFTSFTKYILEV